jgi:hypothetical protein
MLFAAVHESGCGPEAKCQQRQEMSAYQGGAKR